MLSRGRPAAGARAGAAAAAQAACSGSFSRPGRGACGGSRRRLSRAGAGEAPAEPAKQKENRGGDGKMMRSLRWERKKPVTLLLEPKLVEALRRLAAREGTTYQTLARKCLWDAVRKAKDA